MNEEKIIETESVTENIDNTVKKPKKYWLAHPVAKVLLFLATNAALAVLLCCLAVIVDTAQNGLYRTGDAFRLSIDEQFQENAARNFRSVKFYLSMNMENEAEGFLEDRNIAALIMKPIDGQSETYRFSYFRSPYSIENLPTQYVYNGVEDDVEWSMYLLPDLNATSDAYTSNYKRFDLEYTFRLWVLVGSVVCAILMLVFAALFISVIGRSYEDGKVKENFFTRFPFDVVTLLVLFAAYMCIGVMASFGAEGFIVGGGALFILSVLWGINLIHRIKVKNVFRNTLCYKLVLLIWKLVQNIGLIWQTVLLLVIVSFIEFVAIIFASVVIDDAVFFIVGSFLFIEKCILYPFILYKSLMTGALFKAGKEIAKGNIDYKLNTASFFGPYRTHGENLTNLSDAVNKAVDERMKSERMKTELITNVSHDLKTPLTSVINYSDLINTEAASYNENTDAAESMGKISEYSEVLNRQSNKLKRLLDDLVEVSKASSGNMELIMEKLEAGMILSQALGEYEERFEEKNLETIAAIPEESLYIKADSRKLWRVVDNLLQNIYKYSLPSTRVFVEAKETDGIINIIFKNTSRDIITISPDELTERFTRNDESRHQEGNGLGLAIAKTMTEAMKGKFKIDVDGDLFKVTLTFDKESAPEEADANL